MINKSSILDCSVIELPKIEVSSGSITVVDNLEELIPFSVKRVFYIYDIPAGKSRGAHAHKECHQILIALTGSFEVHLDDGKVKRTVLVKQPYLGLHIPPGIWASEQNFSSASICLVLTSHIYDERDYIRDYCIFKELKFRNEI